MKKQIYALVVIMLISIIFGGCYKTDIESNAHSEDVQNADDIHQHSENLEEENEEPADVSVADLIAFASIEEFNNYVAKAEKGDDVAELYRLQEYYTPSGIPENYVLYKITAGIVDIGFWYLPKEYLSSEDEILKGESQQKHYLFISPRNPSSIENIKQQFSLKDEELINEKIYVLQSSTNIVFWEQDGHVMMLYLPYSVEVSDTNALSKMCVAEKVLTSK